MTLIKREDAIDELRRLVPYKKYHKGEWVHLLDKREVFKALNALPSAEAEPTVIRRRTLMPTKDFKEWAKRIREENPNVIIIPRDIRSCDNRDAIKALEQEPRWIPVSERLPEKGEVVLITNGKGNVRCGQYRSEHDVRDGTHYWWWKGKTVESVLAWMPLPKPYREEGE